jgi:hypothetical protein
MRKDISEQLSKALAKIDRPGSFCVSGSAPAVLPGLEVDGLGPVGFPLTADQAEELKKHCEQAPYGKGEETLVDTSVRRVWRMTPDRFTLTNPEWDRFVAETVRKVRKELGLERQKLESHLYDLLLYEPGSFFLPHRDGEKLDRMVATLVIVLPSAHRGGELVVRHDGQEQTIDFAGAPNSAFHVHFAAFYADCEHEIRPLREGHRLCLVYNLTLAKAKKSLSAPRVSEHIDKISPLLREWSADESARKLVVTLGHQYTEDGLAWDTLKGVDRVKAQVLAEAARRADCKAFLALLTFWESGSAVDTGGYGYRRRRWGGGYYADDDSGPHEMDEVFDSSLTATHLCDREGETLPVDELSVEEDELLDPEALRDVVPEEDYEGYTGNEGMTLERWYRHAAILLWPERRYFDVLCDDDSRKILPLLKRMVTQWQSSPEDEALKAQCLALAAAVLARWPENPYAHAYHEEPKTDDLLKTLTALDDPGLIHGLLAQVMIKDRAVDPGKALVTVCQKYGWGTFQPELLAVMKGTTAETLARNLRLLEHFCGAKPRAKEGWLELCGALAHAFIAALEALDREKPSYGWGAPRGDRAEVLAGLARALIATGQDDLLSRVVAHALALPEKYSLKEAHMPALVRLGPWLKDNAKKPCPGWSQWLASCREQLEALTAQAPEEPRDFRRPAAIACHCADCGELKRFLEDPRESVFRFRARQDRRTHLENTIRGHRCDLDLKTERGSSPHTLVCTKNKASYQEKLREYHSYQEHLATVRSIQAGLPK